MVLPEVFQEIYEGRACQEWSDAAIKELIRRYGDVLDEKERLERLLDDHLNFNI